MNVRRRARWILAVLMMAGGSLPAVGQNVSPEDDFDVVVVPVTGTLQPQGGDLSAATLEEMGLGLNLVFGDNFVPFPAPSDDRIRVSTGEIRIELRQGEALQIFSRPIAVSATPVVFSGRLQPRGRFPSQAAIAMIDVGNPSNIGVLLSGSGDLVQDIANPFSYSFEPRTGLVQLVLQFVGPTEPNVASLLTLSDMRLTQGVEPSTFTVDSPLFSNRVGFSTVSPSITPIPPSTAGGFLRITPDESSTPEPGGNSRALLLGTSASTDVIRTLVPLQSDRLNDNSTLLETAMVAVEAYVKRRSGSEGILSLALFSGESGTTGVFEVPVSSLPQDGWMRLRSPALFRRAALDAPQVMLQVRGGPVELLVDDLQLLAPHDSIYVWDSDRVPSLFPDE